VTAVTRIVITPRVRTPNPYEGCQGVGLSGKCDYIGEVLAEG
jgi:hypothetical protein